MNPFRRPLADLKVDAAGGVGIRAEAPAVKTSEGGVATLRLYDVIDSWGDVFGLSAKEFVAALDALPSDTTEVRLLINSPGGEVWEGLAILNALRAHPARVVAVVEGIAASAAADIAVSADALLIMQNAELFVHKAWGLAVGNADDMAKMSADLDHEDRNRASIYAAKAGGTVDDWLAALAGETWYSADEAKAAGLADGVIDPKKDSGGAAKAKARFDLSVFAHHTGRPTATLTPPVSPADNQHPNQEGADMSDTLISGLRERLGINAEVELDDEGLLAAVDEALAEQAEETSSPVVPDGYALVDKDLLAQLQANARDGAEARQQQLADRREQLVSAAINDGRIAPARKQAWLDRLAIDPGDEAVLANLEPVLPLQPKGYTGAGEEIADDAYPSNWIRR